jgi:hypothetical protein
MMDKLVFEYQNRPCYPLLQEDFGMTDVYNLYFYKDGAGEPKNLGYIEERLIDTALWFYMLEKTIDLVVVRDGKIVQTLP